MYILFFHCIWLLSEHKQRVWGAFSLSPASPGKRISVDHFNVTSTCMCSLVLLRRGLYFDTNTAEEVAREQKEVGFIKTYHRQYVYEGSHSLYCQLGCSRPNLDHARGQ